MQTLTRGRGRYQRHCKSAGRGGGLLTYSLPSSESASSEMASNSRPTTGGTGTTAQWVRPLPPRAASRLSGLARRLRCSLSNSFTRRRDDPGRIEAVQKVHTPFANHQSPSWQVGCPPRQQGGASRALTIDSGWTPTAPQGPSCEAQAISPPAHSSRSPLASKI